MARIRRLYGSIGHTAHPYKESATGGSGLYVPGSSEAAVHKLAGPGGRRGRRRYHRSRKRAA